MSYLDNLYKVPIDEDTDILNENLIKDKFKLVKKKFNAFRNRSRNNKLKLAAAAIGGAALGALGHKTYNDYKNIDYINNISSSEVQRDLQRQKRELDDIIYNRL